MTQFDFTCATFDSSIDLPDNVLAALNILPVDFYLLEDAKYCAGSPMGDRIQAHLNELFQGDQNAWTKVGNLSTDDSYYDEEEGKMEYCQTDLVLYVRKDELERVYQQHHRQRVDPLRYFPFSELAFVSER